MAVTNEQRKDYRESPLEYYQGLLDESEKYYEPFIDRVRQANDHYKLTSDHLATRGSVDGRHAFYVPEINPAIRSRVATFLEILSRGDPPIKLTARNNTNYGVEQSVDRMEDYIEYCFEEGHLWQNLYFAMINAERYPFAPVFVDWEELAGKVPIISEDGRVDYETVIQFAGPTFTAIQLEDYRGDLYARKWPQLDPHDMRYHFIIDNISEGELKELAYSGEYDLYDEAEHAKCKTGTWLHKRRTARAQADYPTPFDRPIERVRGWVQVWDDEEQSDIWRECVWAGDMLLKDKPYKYDWIGPPFFILCSIPLPGEVAGMSTYDVGEKVQNLINELWNQKIEATEQSVFSPIFYKGEMAQDPVYEPMAMIQVDDDFDHAPLSKVNTSFDMINDIRFLEERGQQVMSAYDTIQPVQGRSKQTLGEYMGKKDTHNTILGVTAEQYASGIVYAVKLTFAMAREMLPDWMELGLLGEVDALSKLQVQDLAVDLSIEMPKVKSLAMEELNVVKWENLYDKMLANPIVQSNPAYLHEVTKRYLEAMDEQAIERLIGETPTIMPGQMGMAGPMGPMPTMVG